MSLIQLEDFIDYHFLSEVQFSKETRQAIFVLTKQNLKKNKYDSNLFCVDLNQSNPIALTSNNKESNFVVEEDGTLLFSSVRSDEDEAEKFHQKTCFYRLKNHGEARKAFEINLKVLQLLPIPHTSKFAIIVLKNLNALNPDETKKEILEDAEDYIVLEELPYWGNGRGYVSRMRHALMIYDEKDGSLIPVSNHFATVNQVVISDCGNMIYYSAQEYQDCLPHESAIYSYNIKEKTIETILEPNTMKVQDLALSTHNLIFTACDMKTWGSGQNDDFYSFDLNTKTTACIKKYDYSIGAPISSDNRYGSGTYFKVCQGKLYFTSIVGYRAEIYVLENDEIRKCLEFNGSVDCFDVNEEGVVFVGSVSDRLQEIYYYDFSTKQINRVTSFSDEVLKGKEISQPKYIPFIDRHQEEIDAWVILPPHFDETKKYPGILTIHGGPRVAFGELFFHEMQVWAHQGYCVFYCNPHGSDGKGDAFADIRGQYGKIDYEDFMDLTDHVLEQIPQLDGQHLAVAGGSYGGFMTNWIIGNTTRFAAGASQRSVSNWISDYGTSEIGFSFDHNEMGATPWSDKEKMWNQSPIKYGNKVITPTLFIHSLEDYNCPITQGLEMFTALKVHGVPSRVCLFKKENHELSRSGKPRHRIRRLNEITDWFNRYCK